jgi:hypothetical protein
MMIDSIERNHGSLMNSIGVLQHNRIHSGHRAAGDLYFESCDGRASKDKGAKPKSSGNQQLSVYI